jgi:hypothetical protein
MICSLDQQPQQKQSGEEAKKAGQKVQQNTVTSGKQR